MDNNSFFYRTGGIIIVLCIIALLGAFFFSCMLYVKNDVQDISVQIVMPVDSTGAISTEALLQAEELKAELLRHEHLLEDRYKHVLEQKENLNDLLTIGGMFLTIVLALFGFFGYKSLHSIEEKVKQEAESTAKLTAENASSARFESFEHNTRDSLKTDMEKKVKETVDKEMAESKKATKEQLEASLKDQIKDVSKKVEDAEEDIKELRTSMSNLDQKYHNLSEKVGRLEKTNRQPVAHRRTLAEGEK